MQGKGSRNPCQRALPAPWGSAVAAPGASHLPKVIVLELVRKKCEAREGPVIELIIAAERRMV